MQEQVMLIPDIKYVQQQDGILCSMSACLAMLLPYYGIDWPKHDIADLFSRTFLSDSFRDWQIKSVTMDRYDDSTMLSCAVYLINTMIPDISAGIITTDIDKVALSYIKRKIPVIVSGRFPIPSGETPNTVLVRGYVDHFLVVHDPKGNASTGYRDRYGENMMYSVNDMAQWVHQNNAAHILRIIPGYS